MNWDDAACRDHPTEIFFPERGETTGDAKLICSDCPLRADCLEYALLHNIRFGVWGGKSERQRRAMRRERLVIQCDDCGVELLRQLTGGRLRFCPDCRKRRHLESTRRNRPKRAC
jgi:hypothetical protein